MSIDGLDQAGLLWIAGATRSSPTAIAIMKWATVLGDPVVRVATVLVALFALLLVRRRRDAAFVLVAVVASLILSSLVKNLVARPRPNLVPYLDDFSSWSFPSGHAWNGMAAFGGIGWAIARRLSPWWRAAVLGVAMLPVLAIGVSRVGLGVHWPSDVLGGWAGGLATLFLSDLLVRRTGKRVNAN